MPPFGQINKAIAYLRSESPVGGRFQKPDRPAPPQHHQGHP